MVGTYLWSPLYIIKTKFVSAGQLRRSTNVKNIILPKRKIRTVLNQNKARYVKCSSLDILDYLNLKVSRSTLYRTLRFLSFDYKKFPHMFTLNSRMRHKRVEVVRSFIERGIRWNSVIFSDEKVFTLHDTDSFYSCVRFAELTMERMW